MPLVLSDCIGFLVDFAEAPENLEYLLMVAIEAAAPVRSERMRCRSEILLLTRTRNSSYRRSVLLTGHDETFFGIHRNVGTNAAKPALLQLHEVFEYVILL